MKKMISNIVFTKNRPLQLEGYLESLYRHFPQEVFQTYIIYRPELFGEQYQQLFQKFSKCKVIEEKDFSSDFLRVLSEINTKYILFGIDDVVFFDSVDIDLIGRTFYEHKNDILGFTLRFSPESLRSSNDVINDFTVGNQKMYRLNWENGQTLHSRYPFELCCTIYPTELVKRIIGNVMNSNPLIKKFFSPNTFLIKSLGKTKFARKALKSFGYFYNPNTLESWNCRWCQNNSSRLPLFTYFQKLCACAIQVNMVNISTENKFDGTEEHTIETLNNKYKEGYRFDIDFLAGHPPKKHTCGKEYFKLIKT